MNRRVVDPAQLSGEALADWSDAARGGPVDWHYAEDGAKEFFETTVGPRPPITLHHTPGDEWGEVVDVRR